MAPRRKTLRLEDAGRLAGVLSPARIEIVEALQIHGKVTVTELARLLDRPADGLYHHLRRLQEAGIVRDAGARESGGRRAAVLELCADEIRADLGPASPPAFRRAWADAAGAVLRSAEREVRRGARGPRARSAGPRATLHVERTKAWLAPGELEHVNRTLADLRAYLRRRGARRAGAELYTWTSAFAPLPERDEQRDER